MQGQPTRTVRRRKRRTSPLALTLAAALAIIALVGVILLASGYRYISKDGVKFSGHVKNGQPVDGSVHYADGISGKLTRRPIRHKAKSFTARATCSKAA